MDQIDLVNENWSFGRSQGTGTDRRAEFIYMRSADKTRAFGLLTNRTANFYTYGLPHPIDAWGNENLNEESNCVTFEPNDVNHWIDAENQWDYLQSISSLFSGSLMISGLEEEVEYDLTYINPNYYELYPYTPFAGPFVIESNDEGEIALPLQFATGTSILTGSDPFMLVEAKIHDSQFLGRYGLNESIRKDMARDGKADGQAGKLNEAAPALSLSIYPNPTSDMINILAMGDIGTSTISLFDSRGRLVNKKEGFLLKSGVNNINLNGLASGLYQIVISYGPSEVYRNKIVLQ